MSFPTVDALERELRRLESTYRSTARAQVPGYPVEFAVSLGIEPDEWQVEVLASEHPRKILCCGRQTGKSTVGALLAVHKALTMPGSTVLVIAPGERQAKLLFSKARRLYEQAGHPLPAHSERRTGLELANGSIIEALPAVERTTRGYSVDLGQASDFTAIAVLEKTIAPPETAMFSPVGESPSNRLVEGRAVYDLVYLKRPKLGTPYDTIAKRVADLICELEPQGAFGELGQVTLSVDGTGVGRGVVDMLRTEFQRRGATSRAVPKVDFRAVSVTDSNTSLKRPSRSGGYWSVPKRDLVFGGVAAFQQGKIRIAKDITDREALVHELKNYSRKTNIATGSQVFEPWRESQHDDLLFALCLALWGWLTRKGQTTLRVIR